MSFHRRSTGLSSGLYGGEEQELEARGKAFAPLLVKSRVVIAGVISDHHDPMTAAGSGATQERVEAPSGLGCELL